jgi:hypothetical protein
LCQAEHARQARQLDVLVVDPVWHCVTSDRTVLGKQIVELHREGSGTVCV